MFNGGTLRTNASFDLTRQLSMFSQGTIDTNGFDVSASNVISGGGSLVKTGNGMLTLTNVNTYFGTHINGGFLNVGADYSLGDASGGININAGSLRVYAPMSSARAVTLGASGGEFDILGGANSTFSGAIGGSGALHKGGAGMLTLTGSNSYGGTTSINGGTLQIGSGGTTGTLGIGNTAIATGANLTFNRDGAYSYGSTLR